MAFIPITVIVVVTMSPVTANSNLSTLTLKTPLWILAKSDGLGSSQIDCAAVGSGEQIWVGTSAGLDLFSEQKFVSHFDGNNTAPLGDSHVTGLAINDEGSLIVGTHAGVGIFHTSTKAVSPFAWFTDPSGLPDNRITVVAGSKSTEVIWIGTWRGLGLFAQGAFQTPVGSHLLPSSPVSALLPDDNGVWVGFERKGVWHVSNAKADQILPSPTSVLALFRDTRDNEVWIGTRWQGLFQKSRISEPHLPGQAVFSITSDTIGQIWAGTDQGLYRRLKDELWQTVMSAKKSGSVTAIKIERNGIIWAGTWGQGLWRCQNHPPWECMPMSSLLGTKVNDIFECFDNELCATTELGFYRKINQNWLRSETPYVQAELTDVATDKNKRLWIGTMGHGLVRIANNNVVRFAPEHQLSVQKIYDLMEDHSGQLWISSDSGLIFFDGEQFIPALPDSGNSPAYATIISPEGGILTATAGGVFHVNQAGQAQQRLDHKLNDVLCLALHKNELWAGTPKGLFRITDREQNQFGEKDGLPADAIRDIAIDRQGHVWVATTGGISVLKDNRFSTPKSVTPAISLPTTLHSDSQGGIWIGTLGSGAFYVYGEKTWHLSSGQGLPSNIIRDIFADHNDHVWFATDKGLVRLHRDSVPNEASQLSWIWAILPAVLLLVGLFLRTIQRRK